MKIYICFDIILKNFKLFIMSVKNILSGKEKIFKTPQSKQKYIQLNKFSKYETSEQRAYNGLFDDPLSLNFKLLIDFDNNEGLFASEDNKNSALAYLKRIGETVRFEMLKHWIDVFKNFIKEKDYLILDCTGLDLIQNAKAFEQFIEEETTIEFKIRETSDMFIQSLITTYRNIWFDNQRGVEVIPVNLRRFNLNVLVFSAGYYNMLFYDDLEEEKGQNITGQVVHEKITFPTARKLNDNTFKNLMSQKYNHVLYTIEGASINFESGKSFIETVSNEPGGEMVMNNMIFNFQMAQFTGRFNNIMGDFNFLDLLTLMAAQNNATNKIKNSFTELKKFEPGKIRPDVVKENPTVLQQLKSDLINMGKSIKKNTLATLKDKANNIIPKITGRNTVIGNILDNMTVSFAEQMIQNTINLGIGKVEQVLINDPIAKVNNMLFQNFSNNLYDVYKNNSNKPNKPELIQNQKTSDVSNKPVYHPKTNGNVKFGISFGKGNVYNNNGL